MTRRQQRAMLPIKPVSRYQAKQIRAAENGSLGYALMEALKKQGSDRGHGSHPQTDSSKADHSATASCRRGAA